MVLYSITGLNVKEGGVLGESMVLLTAGLFKSGVGGPVGIRLMSAPLEPAVTPIKPTDQPINRSVDQSEEKSDCTPQIVSFWSNLSPVCQMIHFAMKYYS